MVDFADTVFRDFVTDGVPASGTNKPKKSKIREWGKWLEDQINAGLSNGGLIYDTKANLNADLAHGANSSAWVVADSAVANNGIYRKSGASGSGSWSRIADLPYSFIRATDAGAGTANAIVATTSIPLPANDAATLIALNIYRNNTGAATVAFNGGSALTIKTANGNDVQADYLVAGAIVAGYVSGSTFRLISDVGTAADRAAAEAAAAAAAASAASIETSNNPDFTVDGTKLASREAIRARTPFLQVTGSTCTDLNDAILAAYNAGIPAVWIVSRTFTAVSGDETVFMRPGVSVYGVGGATITRENDDLVGKLIDFDTYSADGAKLLGVTVDGNWVDKPFTSSSGMIYVGDADDVEIAGCDIGNCVGAGIRVRDGVRYNIHDNDFRYAQAGQVSPVTSTTTNIDARGRVVGNRFYDSCFHALYNSRHNGMKFSGNQVFGRLQTGFHVTLTDGIITWVSGPTFENCRPGEFMIIHNSSTGGSVECFIVSVDSSTQITTDMNPGYTNQTNQLAACGTGDLVSVSAKNISITDNDIFSGCTGGIVPYSSVNNSEFCDHILISGNRLDGIGSGAVSCQGGANTRWITIAGNEIKNPGKRGAIGNPIYAAGVAVHGAEVAVLIDGNTMVDDQGTKTMQYGIKAGTAQGQTVIGSNQVLGAANTGIYGAVGTIVLTNFGTGATVDTSSIQSDGHRVTVEVTAGTSASGTPQVTIPTNATCRFDDTADGMCMMWDKTAGSMYLGKSTFPSKTGVVANFAGTTIVSGHTYRVTAML